MTEHEIVIAGGGPTGLMLAGELALAGVNVAIFERRASNELDGLRAGGLHIRTLEVLDQRGLANRFISQGQKSGSAPFAHIALDLSDLPTRHNYFLALWQTRIENTLAEWVSELGVPIYRNRSVSGFTQDQAGVEIELSDGWSLHAQYLVGCDGGRSLVRKMSGIEFPGWDASGSYLIAEIETAEEPAWGIRRTEKGINAFAKLEGKNHARVVLHEQHTGRADQPNLQDVREALKGVYGTDFDVRRATYISRFTDMTRQAARYRDGRVLLAGDAAHVHSPVGGQGLNLGVQDAVNLGWKLAQVLRGTSPESLLDTYHAERHPVGARVLRNTMALTAIERSEDRIDALRAMMCDLLQNDGMRKQYVAMMSGLDIRYDFGAGHPLLGRRIPDLDLETTEGPVRVFALLHEGRPVLLNLDQTSSAQRAGGIDVQRWERRLKSVAAHYEDVWELPSVGTVPAPTSVLIRPDGYVAWVEGTDQKGLSEALSLWLGPAAAA